MIEENQIFRIKYEAFSKFSNSLVRCRSLPEVANCFKVNLKYLFNYHVFHAIHVKNGVQCRLTVTAKATTIIEDDKEELSTWQKELLFKKRPFYTNDAVQIGTDKECLKYDEQGCLWAWNFSTADGQQILISILSSDSKRFSQKDVAIVKLVSETLESKLIELCLLSELDKKTQIISQINDDQKKTIKERTKEIELKNKQLLEISILNAHHVREPLSRIMGLLTLLDIIDREEIYEEIIPKLKRSANNLDDALKEVIEKATTDLLQFKV